MSALHYYDKTAHSNNSVSPHCCLFRSVETRSENSFFLPSARKCFYFQRSISRDIFFFLTFFFKLGRAEKADISFLFQVNVKLWSTSLSCSRQSQTSRPPKIHKEPCGPLGPQHEFETLSWAQNNLGGLQDRVALWFSGRP